MLFPAALIAAPLLIGVIVGAGPGCPIWLGVAMVIVAWLGAAASLVPDRRRAFVGACLCGCFGAGLLLGMQAAREASQPSILDTIGSSRQEPVRLVGVLRQDASIGGFGVTAVVDATSVVVGAVDRPVGGGVRAAILGSLAPQRAGQWRQGRTVALTALLREPASYRDFGVHDDRARLIRDHIGVLATVKSAALVNVVARGALHDEVAAAIRRYVRRATLDAVGRWSPKSAGVVTAILIGDRSGLDPDDERRLQEAGTYHVIAISGGNIALLTAMLVLVGRFARVPMRTTCAISGALLLFYGYTAGLAPSVLRATLAGIIYLTSRVIDHRGAPMNALAVAAGLAAALAPLSILDPGFILSFGATLAIVAAVSRMTPARVVRPATTRLRAIGHALLVAAAGLGAATLCAEIALLPVGASLFGRVSFAGLILNFAAVPLMSLIQVAGLAAVAVGAISATAAAACGWIAHAGTIGLLDSARLVDVWPWLVVDVPSPSFALIALWYLAATALVCWWSRATVRFGLIAALGIVGVTMIVSPPGLRSVLVPAVAPAWTRLAFLDVGQGDATLLLPAAGPAILVDAGGAPGSTFDLGRRVTLPAVWALGVTRLGILTLTHGDPDHIGGAPSIVRALRPLTVWEGISVPDHRPLQALHQLAIDRGVTWRSVRTGDAFQFGAARVRVLNPPDADWQRVKVRNDDSIVLDVRVGQVGFILPGDVGQATERTMDSIEPAPVMIVKAPHHGSAGSSSPELIARARPAVVVFSAGPHNPFGHPAPAVVERYARAGARIFRTDQDGEVFVDTDGRQVIVWTWSGRREAFEVR